MGRPVTLNLNTILERLKNFPNIKLDTSTFTNSYTKARFIDAEYGEWWATPKDVLHGKGHPERAKKIIKSKLTLSAQEVQDRLDQQGCGVVIDQLTYVNTKTKARFIDPEFGEWWTLPAYVLNGCKHPERSKKTLKLKIQQRVIPAGEVQNRLNQQGRNIVLDQSTYVNIRTKARFIDPEFGEWWAMPYSVLYGNDHPKRASYKIKARLTLPAQEVQNRLNQQGRNIVLDQSTYVNTRTKAKFIDPEFGEWWAKPNDVLRGQGHPMAGRQKAIATHRLTAQEIQNRLDRQGRGIILDQSTYIDTRTQARFIDPEFGEWWATAQSVLKGSRHPQRAAESRIKKLTLSVGEIQERLNKQGRGIILDQSTYINTHAKARFIDAEFGEWWAKPNDVLKGQGHPKRIFKQNSLERFVAEQLGIEWIGDKKLDGLKYKPDFKLSDKIYLNVDGLYWHSEECRGRGYHFEMREWFESRGMRILQFRENEICDKWGIVKGIIDAVMGRVENRVGARECEIVRMDAKECYDFYEKWHLKGGIKVGGYGLKYKDEVVAIISTKKIGDVVKVERFCVKAGWSVSGGYSRLLERVLGDYSEVVKVQSWVDLRYGDGHSLERMGFVRVKDTLGWEWTDGVDTYNRLRCRANMDKRGLSEKEHAEELGWVRIYDAGQRLFEKAVNK